MKKVSVIMPVYNAKDVLSRSLNQLLAQTLEELEIVLIDDCSTDGSYEFEKSFSDRYPEKILLLQTDQNRGPGGARNLGLSEASGEYIGFVDADDEIVPDMFRMLYEKAVETDSDIVDSGYYNEKEDYALLDTSDELTGELDSAKRSQLIVSGGYIVSKIFRRTFLKQHNLKFRENVSLEDSEFITKSFATAKNIANVKEILYKYTFTDVSASRVRSWEQYYTNVVGAMEANYLAVCELPYYQEIQPAVEYLIVQLYCYGILKCLSVCKEEEPEKIVSCLEQIRDLKQRTVRMDYAANKFIKQKIADDSISIMRLNDKAPQELFHIVCG